MPLLLSTVEVDLLQLTVETLLAGAVGDEARWASHMAATLRQLVGAECGVLALGTGRHVRLAYAGDELPDARELIERAAPSAADVAAGVGALSGTRGWMTERSAADGGAHPMASVWLVDPEQGMYARFVAQLPSSSAGDAVIKRACSVLEIVRPAFSAAVRVYHSSTGALDTASPVQRARSVAAALRERYALTPRETEVTALLLQGRANAQIAQALAISESTARHHTERVLDKLGVRSRAEVPGLVLGQLGTPALGAPSFGTPPLGMPVVPAPAGGGTRRRPRAG